MSPSDARSLLADALEHAGVSYLEKNDLVAPFVSGTHDVAIADLDMDSLAEMELCIGLEVKLGMELVPEDLRQLQTLGGLVTAIVDRHR